MANDPLAERAVIEETLGAAIKAARAAVRDYNATGDAFQAGLVSAYYDVITTMQEQAELLGVEFADKSLAAFDPGKELLLSKRKAA